MNYDAVVAKIGFLPISLTPHIAIIDDDPGVRNSTGMLLETKKWQYSEFERADDFLNTARPSDYNVLLLDVRIPNKTGIELFNELLAKAKKDHTYLPPVIFISGHGDIPMAVQLMYKGAVDFLEKPVNHRTLTDAIASAIENDSIHRDTFVAQYELLEEINKLTGREREVLSEIIGGFLSKQIGEHLKISTKTVEGHRLRICQKFSTRTSMELAAKLRDIPASHWMPEGAVLRTRAKQAQKPPAKSNANPTSRQKNRST
jgi:two-component system response regulator DctR